MSDDEREYDESMLIDEDDDETALEIAALQSENLLPPPKKEFVYHRQALTALLEEISQAKLKWIHRCDITSSAPIVVDRTEDDLDRELKFYQQGLEAAIQGKAAVLKAGVPFTRPDDYFAEMVKTDTHMAKIREKLLTQQKSIQNAEEAKKQRELRKYGKQIQQEKLKEREDKKKASLDKIATIKKRLRSGDLGDGDDFDIDIDSDGDADAGAGERSGPGKKGGRPTPNYKREKKNERFGFGGKKRGMKRNTAESASDISGFSVKRNKSASFGASKKGKRPGKSKRQRGL
ncbi:RRNA processing protein [Coemansia sp. RSA 2611]|nr:RRNA processing protein [Coemansia sp. RSA 2705]KAJ2365447.1 RRNA processing protein [Coemansia sp. RSA 2610]KAJ2387518.1 RRNA processing protein [Coemansia sp. RSA 2611]KAJ2711255.1 rRNA-processing protein EBP2 [Coemansia sp. Cherry 401B]